MEQMENSPEEYVNYIQTNILRLNDNDLAENLGITTNLVKGIIKKHKICTSSDDLTRRNAILKVIYAKLPYIKIGKYKIEKNPKFLQQNLAKRYITNWISRYGEYDSTKMIVFKNKNSIEIKSMSLIDVISYTEYIKQRDVVKEKIETEKVKIRIDSNTVKYVSKEKCEYINDEWKLKNTGV